MITFIKNLFRPKADLAKLVKEGAVIVDVRTKGEFQAGHIEGSKNIPLDGVKTQVQQLKKSGKAVITVCRSGNRSAVAKSILSSAGIEVYNGGAWASLKRQLQ
jgi:phage shock protein E